MIVAAPIANTKLSQQILDLRARLATSDTNQRLDAAAETFGLPKYTEIPRPGMVANWGIDDWINWGSKYGFARAEDSVKARHMAHADYPALRLSYSKSGGDIRSMMNTCCDFRKGCMALYESLAFGLVRLVDDALGGDQNALGALTGDMPSTIAALRAHAKKGYFSNSHYIESPATNADIEAGGAIPSVLRTLEKEFSISARAAFTFCGYGEGADRMVDIYRNPSRSVPPRTAILLLELRTYLDSVRAIAKAELEQKQAARRAERELKNAKREPGTKEKYEREVANSRAQTVTHFATIRAIAENLEAQTQRVMGILKTAPYPEFPGSPVEILEQRDQALSAYDTMELERDALKARVAEDTTTINRLEGLLNEAQKKTGEGAIPAAHRKVIQDLVSAITTKFQNLDLNSIMATIKEVRARATEVSAVLAESISKP